MENKQMTIPDIFYVMHTAKKNNNAKVSLHIVKGVRYLCIHKNRFFDTIAGALSYLREDARSIVPVQS